MPNIQQYEAEGVKLNPTSLGTDSRAGTARRIGAFFNQEASAEESLARSTSHLAGDTSKVAGETAHLGAEKGAAMSEFGRRFGSAIDVAGDMAVKYLDHTQISQGTAAFSRMTERATTAWNEIAKTADPNDPTVRQKFMDSLEPELAKFKDDGFYTENGQKWAEGHAEALRKHMSEKTAADMSTLAGQAAVVNQRQTINSLSATVRGDPSSLDFSLAALKSGTDGMIATSPNLTGVQANAARSEIMQKGAESIVKSAAMGFIEKTGKVPEWATDPKYSPYINGEELKQFAQASRYYQRLGQSEDRSARAQREHEQSLDFNSKVNDLELSTMPEKVGDKPTLPPNYWRELRELGTHPGAALDPGRLKTMVENGEKITERLNKPDPMGAVSHQTTVGLLGRMRATDGTRLESNQPIYDAYGEGKLSTADFNFLTKEFKEMKSPEGDALSKDRAQFFKQYAGVFGSSAGKPYDSAMGSPNLYRAEMAARRIEQDLRKQGKDPHLAYDPSSEYFFGKPARISQFQADMQADLRAQTAAPPPAEKPPMDGAQKARDGNWYVRQGDKYFRVDK